MEKPKEPCELSFDILVYPKETIDKCWTSLIRDVVLCFGYFSALLWIVIAIL